MARSSSAAWRWEVLTSLIKKVHSLLDVELMKIVSDRVSIPVIASGGMGALDHASDVVLNGNVDAMPPDTSFITRN